MRSRVLIIEDDHVQAELTAQAIGDEFMSDIVSTLEDGLRFVDAVKPDAILLDLNLQDSSGMDTLQNLQANQPGVPIVVLTGSHELTAPCILEGAQDALDKGTYGPSDLCRVVRHAIVRHKVRGVFAPVLRAIKEAKRAIEEIKLATLPTSLPVEKAEREGGS